MVVLGELTEADNLTSCSHAPRIHAIRILLHNELMENQTNGAQDENRTHDLRITSGSNTVRFFDRLLSAFG